MSYMTATTAQSKMNLSHPAPNEEIALKIQNTIRASYRFKTIRQMKE